MSLIRKAISDHYGSFELIKPDNFIDVPEISVVMSVYNGQRYLRESVDSVLNQTYKNFEFIIVNDGSDDGSQTILLNSQAGDNRILIVNQENIGLTKSLNRAIRLTAGRYIARQDADDLSAPTRLQKQLDYLKNHPKVAVVGCLRAILTSDGVIQINKPPTFSPIGVKRFLARNNLFMHGSAMIRKVCLKKTGLYREFFRCSQDYDLWLRLSQHFDLATLPEHLYQYRVTPEAVSVARYRTQKQYANIARQLHSERLATGKDSYDALISSYPAGLPGYNEEVDQGYYHIFIAMELISANRLNHARKQLWKAWKLGTRNWQIFCLFLKTLLGLGLLTICRELKNRRFEI